MARLSPNFEAKLRRGFKYFNHFMLLMWRLGLGPWVNAWPEVGGRIMVLAHMGRKTGSQRHTPVNYALVEEEIYCTAGFGSLSDWYRNILANPRVEVWLPEGWWAGIAEEVSDPAIRVPLMRQVITASGFAGRLAGLDPQAMSDQALEAATANYPLLHIRRAQARTGRGGPGDLFWIWPLATFALILLMIFRRKR